MAQTVKRLSAMQETWVRSLGWEDPLEKEMAAHSSILVWKIPWTRSLVGYCPWGRKESDTTERLHFTSLEGLMLKPRYFGHLMRRANSLEKTLILGKMEGRRRGQQRMRR